VEDEVEDVDEPERSDSRRSRRSWKAVEDMVNEMGGVMVVKCGSLGRALWDAVSIKLLGKMLWAGRMIVVTHA
jgi:hypothetical protein